MPNGGGGNTCFNYCVLPQWPVRNLMSRLCGDRKAYYRNATSRHVDLQPLPEELVQSVCNGPLSSIGTSAADQIT
jgi:hypothetical protein